MSSKTTHPTVPNLPTLNPADYELTEQDRHALKTDRGLTDETIDHCRFGSVKNQADLDTLGFSGSFQDLKSTVLIPYLTEGDGFGKYPYKLHKLNLPDVELPAYLLDVLTSKTLVITEAPLKAAAAYQLGYPAVGLNGIHSHVNRIAELREIIKQHGFEQVIVHLDTELTADGSAAPSLVMALAYARALETKTCHPIVVELPERFLKLTDDGKRKADLDGALAAGMTVADWQAQIGAGYTFSAHPASVATKAVAIWAIEKERLFEDTRPLTKVLKDQSASAKMAALEALIPKIRNLAWDEETEHYSESKLEAFDGELSKLAKDIGLKLTPTVLKRMLRPEKVEKEKTGAPSVKECGYAIRNDRLYRVGTKPTDSAPFLVSNVVPHAIRSGTLRYLRGPMLPFHVVSVHGRSEPIKIKDSLFDATAWEKAGEGTITIPGAGAFKQYVDHAISVDKIQQHDPSLNSVLWIGTYREAEQLKIIEGTHFPQEVEECPYDRMILPDSATNDVLELMRGLYSDCPIQITAATCQLPRSARPQGDDPPEDPPESAAEPEAPTPDNGDLPTITQVTPYASDTEIWLLWVLGTLLKPAFGDTYPHLAIEGHKESGKTTIANEFVKRFKLCLFSAADQFSTSYRTRKSFSNTNLPIIVDEVNRLRGPSAQSFVTVLNSAYNISYSTHGDRSKYFILGAPAMILGQEWPYSDAALNAKTIILKLDSNCKQAHMLDQLRNCPDQAPVKRWAQHACNYVSRVDLCTQANLAVTELSGELTSCEYDKTTESGRTIWNYATLLVTAEAAIDFGLKLDREAVKNKLAAMLCQHLGGDANEEPRRTIGHQFLSDLVDELQSRSGRGSFTYEVTSDALIFNLPHALRVLQSKGHIYDISTSRSMADHLRKVGGDYQRYSLNGVQKRCCSVPLDILKGMDLDVSGLCMNEPEVKVRDKEDLDSD